MGSIGGMLGTAGGINGTGLAGPQHANITNPTDPTQIKDAYSGVQNSMESQKALLAAIQAQNGLGNQSQVYNQLQGVAAGTGPNPAQAQLAQATGANVANQAALMAGQRGAAANVGLMARQAAQQGAGIQQQAAGQAATLQAQQSLNAINSAGGIANTQAANQIGQTNANVSSQQAEQQNLLNAQAAYNNAQVGSQSSVNSVNGQLANTAMQGQQALVGGVMKAGGAAAGMAAGGEVGAEASAFQGPQSKFGQFLGSQGQAQGPQVSNASFSSANPGADSILHAFDGLKRKPKEEKPEVIPMGKAQTVPDINPQFVAASGGMVSSVLSPGEKYLNPSEAREVASGKKSPATAGKVVPGQPKYKGNNYANDVVPAKLKEGGVVIPNSIMQSKDPVRGAADFVRAALAKKGMKK